MLNRFLKGKQTDERGPKQKRPYLASEVSDLNEADKWRQQILREIGKKVMEIQNAGLGEHRCVYAAVLSCIVIDEASCWSTTLLPKGARSQRACMRMGADLLPPHPCAGSAI